MLKAIREFFERNMGLQISDDSKSESPHALQLATAALMIEMMRADFDEKPAERATAYDNLLSFFDLSTEEAETLISLAEQEADEGVSLHQFTSLINQNYYPEQKRKVVKMLWRISFADGHKDMHEEHLVRKVANLLYVPHAEFIRTRHEVEAELAERSDGAVDKDLKPDFDER